MKKQRKRMKKSKKELTQLKNSIEIIGRTELKGKEKRLKISLLLDLREGMKMLKWIGQGTSGCQQT